jgi:HEPN domain-containing protein
LKTLGDFPKIHSLKDLIDVCENNCLRKLVDEKWYIVDVLEDADIGGRYFIRRYNLKRV